MKILLSGCTGFIGRHLTRELSLEGHEIVSLTRRTEYDGLFSARNVRYVTWNDGRHSGTTALFLCDRNLLHKIQFDLTSHTFSGTP